MTILNIILRILFVGLMAVVTAIFSGIVASPFIRANSTGFDAIADGLGALMLGTLIGFVIALILVFKLSQTAINKGLGLGVFLLVLEIGGLVTFNLLRA